MKRNEISIYSIRPSLIHRLFCRTELKIDTHLRSRRVLVGHVEPFGIKRNETKMKCRLLSKERTYIDIVRMNFINE